jgi:catechol 2,3-dioxygenase-like lactoylglutathione lyase family enzyme
MIDHVSVGVRSLEDGASFYDAVLGTLGYTRLATRSGAIGFGKRYPEFWINLRAGMRPLGPDSGNHVCLRASSAQSVDAFHRVAVAAGGLDDGGPGPRIYTQATVYAAFIRDPDGNRIEVVTFSDERSG